MARGLNRIQIIGHLGRDPEMRCPPSGQPTTTFSVAVNRGRREQDGQRTEETDWFRVVCWNKLAETVDQYLKKGQRVYIEGQLQIRKYIANGGEQQTAVEIVANDLLMLSVREEGTERPSAPANGNKGRRAPAKTTVADPFDDELDEFDDLPF
jgi:single-strand DNA-binding protein